MKKIRGLRRNSKIKVWKRVKWKKGKSFKWSYLYGENKFEFEFGAWIKKKLLSFGGSF